MYRIGIDMGSGSTKTAVLQDDTIVRLSARPTGWSSAETATEIRKELELAGYLLEDTVVTATGYGRVSVPYAKKTLTEISCHAKGAGFLFHQSGTVIDIGGQDTKIIAMDMGTVTDFIMNDKCAAGTGRFLEVMANSMGITQEAMTRLAMEGSGPAISSMCTVFAETEVIHLIGSGEPRENIAHGILESVVNKVVHMAEKLPGEVFFLTGGLCYNAYIASRLEAALGRKVLTCDDAWYAGAIGAALSGSK